MTKSAIFANSIQNLVGNEGLMNDDQLAQVKNLLNLCASSDDEINYTLEDGSVCFIKKT